MRILLTNDDGIHAPGLQALEMAIATLDNVELMVIAPEGNRSGVSNALSMHNPLRLVKIDENHWSCSGTPADCVLLGVLGALPFKPDLVLSGINSGPNIGTDIVYSGTAAAARQAALHGLPGIALSLAGFKAPWHWEGAANFVASHIQAFLDLCCEDVFLNINIPNTTIAASSWCLTWPGRRRYRDALRSFLGPDGNSYFFIGDGTVHTEWEEGCDQHAIDEGKVSVSPVFLHPVVRKDCVDSAPEHAYASARPEILAERLSPPWAPVHSMDTQGE